MSADAGWGARHASRAAPLGRKYIEGSASQVRLHHYQARNGLLPTAVLAQPLRRPFFDGPK